MRLRHCLWGLLAILFLISCNQGTNRQGEQAIVKVGNRYLYKSDLPVGPGFNLPAEDSARMQRIFIEKWIKSQLLLQKAELNIPKDDQDVSEQLEEYRKSLLIYKYQQMLLKQQLDTLVTEEQIQEYFNAHNSGYVLTKPVFRGVFIQLMRPAANLEKVRQWCRSDSPEALAALEEYCRQNAFRYDFSPDQWLPFEQVQSKMPARGNFGDWVLRSYKFYETQDTTSVYLLSVKDYRMPGAPTPVELVQANIRNIVLNKRKIEFLNTTENDLYKTALSRNQVEYLNP